VTDNLVDFSRLEDPEFYRGRFRPHRTTRGKATRPSGKLSVIDPQPVHRYQAVHAERVHDKAPMAPSRAALVGRIAVWAVVFAGVAIAGFYMDDIRAWRDSLDERGLFVLGTVITLAIGGGVGWVLRGKTL